MTLPNQPKPTICPICGKPTKGMPFHTCCRTQEPESAAAPDGLKALRARVKELEEINKRSCQDWAEDDTFLDNLLAKHEIKMWGDSHGMPCIQDKAEALSAKLTAASEVIEKCGGIIRTLNDAVLMGLNHQGHQDGFKRFPQLIWKEMKRSREVAKQAIAAIKEWKARP